MVRRAKRIKALAATDRERVTEQLRALHETLCAAKAILVISSDDYKGLMELHDAVHAAADRLHDRHGVLQVKAHSAGPGPT